MQIELTEKQEREIALAWIEKQKQKHDGYKDVLKHLFSSLHFANWSWLDAINYAVKTCSKNYSVSTSTIKSQIESNSKKS